MKLATYKLQGEERIGVVLGDRVIALNPELNGLDLPAGDWSRDMVAFIEAGETAKQAAAKVLDATLANNVQEAAVSPLAQVELLAPIPRPVRNIFCVGRNIQAHVEEGDRVWKDNPGVSEECIFFTKATNAINHPNKPISGFGLTKEFDYEVELAIVIGKRGRDISREEAKDYVFAYTIANDVTARDMQQSHRQWFKGKSLDGSCPLGPWLVTPDELPWPLHTDMRLYVNGELRQDLNTRDMIWDIPAIIESLSRGMTLEPGDIIATGTGAGCGFGFDPPRFLQPGDVVRLEIDGIGVLENPVV